MNYMKKIYTILLIILISCLTYINYTSFISRSNYSDKFYEVTVYDDKTLIRSVLLDKYPDINNGSITITNPEKNRTTYINYKIIITEIKDIK